MWSLVTNIYLSGVVFKGVYGLETRVCHKSISLLYIDHDTVVLMLRPKDGKVSIP